MSRRAIPFLGSYIRSLAIIVNGRVVDKYGSEALEYMDLLGLASDYNGTLILIRDGLAVIVRDVLGIGIIIVAREEALGMGLLTLDRLAGELVGLGQEGGEPFEEVSI
mgnify:CR=1 FL=1